MDSLAKQGVLFSRAYCAAPACNPSRVSVLTGLHPTTSGVYVNRQPFREAHADLVTLPQLFKKNGYKVYGAGKVEHTGFIDRESYDEYYPSWDHNVPSTAMPTLNEHTPILPGRPDLDWAALDVPDEEMGDFKTTEWARKQLTEAHDKPFFLAVGLSQTHLPWFSPRSYVEKFPPQKMELPPRQENDLEDIPPSGRKLIDIGLFGRVVKKRQWKKLISGYLATINFVDGQVGRLLDALESGPHKGNTIVVLFSDHGFQLGQKKCWKKFTLWEQSLRVPLIIAGPGIERGNCELPVSLIDIYPTLAELCHLPWNGLDGQSLRPLLKDPASKWERPVLSSYLPGNHTVRSQNWRYIRYEDGSEELYQNAEDPWEWTNLANDPEYAPIKIKLAQSLPRNVSPYRPEPKSQ